MKPLDIYHQAKALGLELKASNGKVRVFGNHCPEDFANILREHKSELLDWLARPPCPGWGAIPPADLPLDPAPPSPSPEDRERIISYIFRQGCDRPSPLCAWVVRRECAYYDGPGRHWDCAIHAYAAARDAACWQLSRTESEVWEFLEATAEVSR